MKTAPQLNRTKLKQFFLLIILLITSCSQILAQTNFQTELNNIKKLESKSSEKVYLQLDREIFSTGERIWFKAYLLEGTFHTLISTSNNLHVELIAPSGIVVSKQTILLYNGTGYGDLYLNTETIKEGLYRIRAYTNFMRNFDEDIFFQKNILITQNVSMTTEKTEEKSQNIDLQFFPEGGELVKNILNRLAFKATNKEGIGVSVNFSIFDQNGTLIQKAESIHKGMGQFMFIPKTNTSYYAVINSFEGKGKRFQLPEASANYSILVGNQYDDLLDFSICTSPENVNNQKVSYIIQSRGKLFSTNNILMTEATKSVRIKKQELPSGISCITVFDEHNIPVCERLIYNQLAPKVNINITTDKKVYKTREKVNLIIETRDESGNPVPAQLSMSVIGKYITDKQNEILTDNANIFSSIFLSSDLKGRIEEPNFYFENFNKEKHYYLDLLLLTQGWRKYIWKKKVEEPIYTMNFRYENGFTFSGTSKTTLSKHPIPNSKVSLVISDGGFYYDETTTDSEGYFRFNNVHFLDTAKLVFQAYNKRNKRNTIIEIDTCEYNIPPTKEVSQSIHYSNTYALNKLDSLAKINQLIKDTLASKNHRTLEEITVKAFNKKKVDNHFRLYREANKVITIGNDFIGYTNILDIIKGRVSGVEIIGTCPNASVIIRGNSVMADSRAKKEPNITQFEKELAPDASGAQFLVDGAWVSIKEVCNLDPSQIDKIEVLKGAKAAIFGNRGMTGIIAVYTKDGEKQWDYIPVGIIKIKPTGYYRAREFYSPNYENTQEKFEGHDFRNTLYWDPFVNTGKDGKAELYFFNSDATEDYSITIEGVGLNGSIGKASSSYSVGISRFSSN